MASLKKFTHGAVLNQLRHNERTLENPSNEDIGPERSGDNYSLFSPEEGSCYDRYLERKEELYCYNRSDVKTMAAWIVTAPEIERKAMLNNFLYKAILGAGDTDTQEYFAKMIGHKQEKSYSRTTGRGAASITERQEKTWAIEPDELGRLRKDLVLLHPAGHDKLRKTPYYKKH